MNPELVKFLQETLQQGKDFVIEQTPLVVQETLRWAMVEATLWIIISLIPLAACVWLVKLALRYSKEDYSYDDRIPATTIPAVVLGLLGAAILCTNLSTLLYVYTAPRLYLLDRLSQVVK